MKCIVISVLEGSLSLTLTQSVIIFTANYLFLRMICEHDSSVLQKGIDMTKGITYDFFT